MGYMYTPIHLLTLMNKLGEMNDKCMHRGSGTRTDLKDFKFSVKILLLKKMSISFSKLSN